MILGTGQTPVKAINIMLRDVIIGGQASSSFIVDHRISIGDGHAAYKEFSHRVDSYTEVLLKF